MKETDTQPNLWQFLKFSFKNYYTFKAMVTKNKISPILTLANIEIGKMDLTDPLRDQRISEFNQAMIEYYKGRWYATQAHNNNSKKEWELAFANFKNANKKVGKLRKALINKSRKTLDFSKSKITTGNTEIKFADGVPLVPEITPIVILNGTDFEMGQQYAKQIVQIFGKWILEQKANQDFTKTDLEVMRKWEDQHKKYTPEILEFCKGWVQGAKDAGIIMSYEDVLDLWVGHKEPATNPLNAESGMPELPPLACSGNAAWGKATKDGKLVTGSSGDHSMSYQVTIIAFPKNGNNYIYSPFSAIGSLPTVGDCWFFGHPAMNDKGLAYVHHGGGPKFLEPEENWGYGIRRAASVMHILRFANTAKEALKIEKNWPIGDVGYGDQATVGGFYADDNYGYVLEGRKEPFALREAGLMGETDFLYANNGPIHPDVIKSEWMAKDKDKWQWDKNGGWYSDQPGLTKSFGLIWKWFSGRVSVGELMTQGMMGAFNNSCKRNKFAFEKMNQTIGKIDFEFMKSLFSISGTLPDGSWNKIAKEYKKYGKWGEISVGHSSNAIVVAMKPSEGKYACCAGPIERGITPMSPDFAISIYGETNAFWEIKLGENPKSFVTYVKNMANEYLQKAKKEIKTTDQELNKMLVLAEKEFEKGKLLVNSDDICDIAKSTRAFTRSQVRALQALSNYRRC